MLIFFFFFLIGKKNLNNVPHLKYMKMETENETEPSIFLLQPSRLKCEGF